MGDGARSYSVRPSHNPDLGGAEAASAIPTTWEAQPSWDVTAPAGLDALHLVDMTRIQIANPSALSGQGALGIVGSLEQRGRH